VIGLLVWVFLELTRHGRLMYAIGSNERAAALAGTNVNRYKITAYMISGVLASIGGILLAARLGRGDIASGNNLLLDSVAAADRLCCARRCQTQRFWHGDGRALCRHLAARPDDDERTLLHPGLRQGRVLVVALMFTFALSTREARAGH
jgi:simple sugar transport system permease protein